MSETTNELLNLFISFILSNAISIGALIISFLAFLMSFKSYIHISRADIEIEVDGDWKFDYFIKKTNRDQYEIKNRGKVGKVSVKNIGGVKSTLEAAYLVEKTFRGKKQVNITSGWGGGDIIGVRRSYDRFPYLSFKDVIVEPGDRIRLEKFDRDIFEKLFKKGLFDLSKQDQGQFQLVIKHTFAKEKSNPFRIVLSPSSLRFLQLGCDNRAFIDEYKTEME